MTDDTRCPACGREEPPQPPATATPARAARALALQSAATGHYARLVAFQVREDLTAIRLHARLGAHTVRRESVVDVRHEEEAVTAAVGRIAALMDALEAGS